jgi:hypothetical protein
MRIRMRMCIWIWTSCTKESHCPVKRCPFSESSELQPRRRVSLPAFLFVLFLLTRICGAAKIPIEHEQYHMSLNYTYIYSC